MLGIKKEKKSHKHLDDSEEMQPSEESEMSEELLQQLGKFVVDSDIIKDGARSLSKSAWQERPY